MALRSTEGFLAADVISAALQRNGWNGIEKKWDRKAGRKTPNDKSVREKKGKIELDNA